MTIEQLILVGGSLHFVILIASAMVPRILNWNRELGLLSQFLRRLFWVYGVFIVLTIVGLGAISLACAPEIAAGTKLARAFCAFVAIFWGARLAVQFFVFDARPYLTHWFLKAGYHGLAVLFATLVAIYGWAALREAPGF
jgi:hypothetical protein